MISLRPSKRVALVFIACMLAVGAVVFAAGYSETSGKSKVSDTNSNQKDTFETADSKNSQDSEFLKKISNLDDDGDGIKNWEESLAISAGASGAIGANGTGSAGAASTEDENLSETEKLSREFFAKYMEAKQSGTVDQQSIVEDLINSHISSGVTTGSKIYTAADIKIAAQSKNEAIFREYGNKFGQILLNYRITDTNNEYQIITGAMENTATAQANAKAKIELQALNPSIARYEGIVRELKLISVPAEAVFAHLEIMNAFEAIKNDISGLKKIFSDPVVGIISFKKYNEDTAALNTAVDRLKNLFADRDVVFTQSEYGFALTNAI